MALRGSQKIPGAHRPVATATGTVARWHVRKRMAFSICRTVALGLLAAVPAPAQGRGGQKSTWLWVKDHHTHLGIARAALETGPGTACVGRVKFNQVKWGAHYLTGPAGRILIPSFPQEFSCRVTLDGRELEVAAVESEVEIHTWTGPKWVHAKKARQTIIWVRTDHRDEQGEELDDWRTSNDPTQFRAYIQDLDARQLVPDVQVTALRSGITTASDANGLFTLEVPAADRRGKTPPTATETLVFSKPGYQRFEYQDLILHPGLNPLEILLERGTGTVVRRNGSLRKGGSWNDDQFFAFKGTGEAPDGGRGRIISLEIEPSAYERGWILCTQ